MSDLQSLAQSLRNLDRTDLQNRMGTVATNFEPQEIIDQIFLPVLNETRHRYHQGEIAIPELLLSMQLLMNLLSHLNMEQVRGDRSHNKIVLGVIEGDPHDMGKNIVKRVYECYGLEVYDLGKDVSIHRFAQKASETNADMVGISTMMSTTVDRVSQAIQLVKKEHSLTKVMVGGAFMTPRVAEDIGADGYAESAATLIEETDRILSKVNRIANETHT
jgi:5-methyltetrahydrofolate--homocysteine methyltransferase